MRYYSIATLLIPIVAMAADDGKEWGRGEHALRSDYEDYLAELETFERIKPAQNW